jgi:hypothetical protein
MLLEIIQLIILLLIIASFILQMLVLLGNFPGLRSVYIVKVNMIPVPGSTNVFMDKLRELYFTSVPDYFTMSILRICGNYNSDPSKDVCSPASLGFRYSNVC